MKTRHLKDVTSQTSYSDLTTLVSHRKKEQQLERTVENLQAKLRQAEQAISTLQARHAEEMKAHRDLHDWQFEKMRVMYEQEVKIRARNRVRAAILADVHHTNHGACWHASFQCASQRTANVTYTLRLQECAHTLGENWLGVETAAVEAAEAALDAAEAAYATFNAAGSAHEDLSTGVNSTPSNER